MPVVPSTQATRAAVMRGDDPRIEENASAKLARKREEARQAAEALNEGRVDTTTPLVGRAPLETVPEPPKVAEKAKKPAITLSTTVQHRGRVITITATDVTVDRFCDLLDQASYAAPAPAQWQTLPDGTPICPKHNTPMRKREKQGDEWWSHKVYGPDGNEMYCKGYHGKDSPGYEH